MLSLLALSACSPAFDSNASLAPSLRVEDVDVPTESDHVDAVGAAPQHLYVSLPELTGRTVEVLPYFDGETPRRFGTALASEVVDGPVFELDLPSNPAAVGGPARAEEVRYAIVLRETASDGSAGSFLGISDAHLVWTAEDENGESGWDLVINPGDDDEQVLDFDLGASLYENLQAPATLELSGQNLAPIPNTHVVLHSCDGDDCTTAFDAPLAPDVWSLSIGGAPATFGDVDNGLDGAVYTLDTYVDANGDMRRTNEALTGEACLGLEPVVVTWISTVWDLDTALWMQKDGYRAGWMLYLDTQNGWVPVFPEDYDALVLNTACG